LSNHAESVHFERISIALSSSHNYRLGLLVAKCSAWTPSREMLGLDS
jgi:hypothetical protein